MATEIKPESHYVESLVYILIRKGFRVEWHCEEVNEKGEWQVPVVCLHKDDDGVRAAKIAAEEGYPISSLNFQRTYINGVESGPRWVLEILVSGMVDETELVIIVPHLIKK